MLHTHTHNALTLQINQIPIELADKLHGFILPATHSNLVNRQLARATLRADVRQAEAGKLVDPTSGAAA